MQLTPRQHIRTTADFEAARAEGVRVETSAFRFQIRLRKDSDIRRLGVIASRRVGGAVQRNRCKRLLREAFRLNQEALPAGSDLVLISRRRLLGMKYPEVREQFMYAVNKAAKRAGAGDAVAP